ncbi:unnamed protein product, partial [Phytomonas sp. Hart1]
MLKKTSTRLLSFSQLFCGEDTAKLIHNEEQCRQLITTFRQLSPNAPLPIPVATAYTTSCIKNKNYRDAVATISSYSQPEKLVLNLKDYFHEHKDDFSAEDIKETLVLLRDANAPGVIIFLNILANHCISDSSCSESLKSEVRQMIVSHIRFIPYSAPKLLRSLCTLSSSNSDCGDIMEVVKIAIQKGYIDPRDFGIVMDVLLARKDYTKITALWSWMRHTSARWNQRTASAAICAFSWLEQIDQAIACIQCLAEVNIDPTIDAQSTFTYYLANRIPPLPEYVEQLMRHWHPEQHTLWTGPAYSVGIKCIFAFFRAKMHREVICLLDEASRSMQNIPEAMERFVKHKGMHVLMGHYSSEIDIQSPIGVLFYDNVKGIPDLADYPLLMASFFTIGLQQGQLLESYETLSRNRSISKDDFEQLVRFSFRSIQEKYPHEALDILKELARRMQKDLPSDIEAWLELFDSP